MSAAKQKTEAADWRKRLIACVRTLALQHTAPPPRQAQECPLLSAHFPEKRPKAVQFSAGEPAKICNIALQIHVGTEKQEKRLSVSWEK